MERTTEIHSSFREGTQLSGTMPEKTASTLPVESFPTVGDSLRQVCRALRDIPVAVIKVGGSLVGFGKIGDSLSHLKQLALLVIKALRDLTRAAIATVTIPFNVSSTPRMVTEIKKEELAAPDVPLQANKETPFKLQMKHVLAIVAALGLAVGSYYLGSKMASHNAHGPSITKKEPCTLDQTIIEVCSDLAKRGHQPCLDQLEELRKQGTLNRTEFLDIRSKFQESASSGTWAKFLRNLFFIGKNETVESILATCPEKAKAGDIDCMLQLESLGDQGEMNQTELATIRKRFVCPGVRPLSLSERFPGVSPSILSALTSDFTVSGEYCNLKHLDKLEARFKERQIDESIFAPYRSLFINNMIDRLEWATSHTRVFDPDTGGWILTYQALLELGTRGGPGDPTTRDILGRVVSNLDTLARQGCSNALDRLEEIQRSHGLGFNLDPVREASLQVRSNGTWDRFFSEAREFERLNPSIRELLPPDSFLKSESSSKLEHSKASLRSASKDAAVNLIVLRGS